MRSYIWVLVDMVILFIPGGVWVGWGWGIRGTLVSQFGQGFTPTKIIYWFPL